MPLHEPVEGREDRIEKADDIERSVSPAVRAVKPGDVGEQNGRVIVPVGDDGGRAFQALGDSERQDVGEKALGPCVGSLRGGFGPGCFANRVIEQIL